MDVGSLLDRLAGGVAAVDSLDDDTVDDAELRAFVLGVHAAIERLRVVEARALHHVERRAAWAGTGARDAAAWLAERTNGSYGDAARQARLGDLLVASPELAAAVDEGIVSVSVAEAIAPTATDAQLSAGVADELLPRLRGVNPREARREAERWAASKRSGDDDDTRRLRAQARRFLRFGSSADGSTSGTFNLPDLDARTVRQAIEHLAGKPAEHDPRSREQMLADALVALCDAYARGTVSGGRERPSLLVIVDDDIADGSRTGNATTSFDDLVADADLQRIVCDCTLHRIIRRAPPLTTDLGRATPVVSRALWLALATRDRRCRWPGCTMPPGWCDAHHIAEWTRDLGPTDQNNLALFCRHHHSCAHLPGYAVTGTAQHVTITQPDGTTLHSHPPDDQPAGQHNTGRQRADSSRADGGRANNGQTVTAGDGQLDYSETNNAA